MLVTHTKKFRITEPTQAFIRTLNTEHLKGPYSLALKKQSSQWLFKCITWLFLQPF